ncbi:magnetosome protein Man5-Cter [Candidatus Magnetobacterium bavaricum]|uniref:Magnetosome protein Man5-Cter n=1 Tax=Candidatus Magnetobacterium bavaricum TaxID=29290 RepID=A0A0F3GSE5_9BACT|nr:magnetosome protein Man5-Cter [Candidatus Magnetobacterium bavaricum]
MTTYDINIRDLNRDLEARQETLNTQAADNAQSKEELKRIDGEIAQKDSELQALAVQQKKRDEVAGTLEKTLNALREAYMDKMILDNDLQSIDNKAALIAQAVRL